MSKKPLNRNQRRHQAAQPAFDKRTLWVLIPVIALIALIVIGATTLNNKPMENGDTARAQDPSLLSGKHFVQIDVKDYGSLICELNADVAPISVTNFLKLADEGFYDGLTFHRIISNFMIQGGDPLGNGTGGSEVPIKGEFAANNYQNDIQHLRGAISMARSANYDSGSSQFFIVHQDSPHLDGQYAAFGHVLVGMEVVDAICAAAQPTDGNGSIAPEQQPVIERIVRIGQPE